MGHHGAKSAKSAKMLSSEPPVSGDGSGVAASIPYSVFRIQFSVFGVRDGWISRVRFIDPRTQSAGVGGGVCLQPGIKPEMLVHALMVAVMLSAVRCARNARFIDPGTQSAGVGGGICLLAVAEQSNLFSCQLCFYPNSA